MTWREYHDTTKHTPESIRRSQHMLEWANMPDPFRHYEGVPVLDLPADPPAPGTIPAADGPAFLSQLLFYAAAVSATKTVLAAGYRYAARQPIFRQSASHRISFRHSRTRAMARRTLPLPRVVSHGRTARTGQFRYRANGRRAPHRLHPHQRRLARSLEISRSGLSILSA